jgi:hypothetical protein
MLPILEEVRDRFLVLTELDRRNVEPRSIGSS